MDKLTEYKDYLKQDPEDDNRVIVTIEMSVAKAAVNAGGIEMVAIQLGWIEDPSVFPDGHPFKEQPKVNPCDFFINYVKDIARNAMLRAIEDTTKAAAWEAQQELVNKLL